VRIDETRRAGRVLAACLVAIAAASAASAETRPEHPYRVQTGQRVRLWSAPENGGFLATNAVVTATDATGLTVVIKDRTELVPFASLARLEVRRGWRYLRRAAAIGLVVGAGIGTVTAASIWPARWVPVDLDSIRANPDRAAIRLSFRVSF
jgi:hypothetical protein